jgi:hypothetical protein
MKTKNGSLVALAFLCLTGISIRLLSNPIAHSPPPRVLDCRCQQGRFPALACGFYLRSLETLFFFAGEVINERASPDPMQTAALGE